MNWRACRMEDYDTLPESAPQRRGRLVAACAAGALLMVAAARAQSAAVAAPSSLASREGWRQSMQNVTATPTSTLNVTQLLLYKETFLSLNSSADASFLVSNFGFGSNALTFKAGPSSSGITAADGTCGVRTTMTAVTQALLHVTETKDYFEGPIEAATWIRGCFNRLHGNMSADDWGGWDRFMSMSTAFYYTDLSLTFSVLKSKGIPFAGRKYVNPIDGETMYVVFVNIPASKCTNGTTAEEKEKRQHCKKGSTHLRTSSRGEFNQLLREP